MTSTKNKTVTIRIGISEEAWKILETERIGFEKPGQTLSRIIIEDHKQTNKKPKQQKTKTNRKPIVTTEQEDIEK